VKEKNPEPAEIRDWEGVVFDMPSHAHRTVPIWAALADAAAAWKIICLNMERIIPPLEPAAADFSSMFMLY